MYLRRSKILYTLMKKLLAIIGALIGGGLGIALVSSATQTALATICPTCHN
jgi:hypothetical protein